MHTQNNTQYTAPQQSHILLATTALSVIGLWWWLQRHVDLSIHRPRQSKRQMQTRRVQIRQYLNTTTLNMHVYHRDGDRDGGVDGDNVDPKRVTLLDIAYTLGSGATADVLQVTSTSSSSSSTPDDAFTRHGVGNTPTGDKYALKIMKHDNICFKPHDVASEIAVLRAVATCKNTIDYVGVAYMDQCTVIVMRPFGNGCNTLSSWMTKRTKWSRDRGPDSGAGAGESDGWTIMLHLFRQLLAALAFLERRRIVHRDVRPANILIDEAVTSSSQHLKLIDFGLACRLDARGFAHGEVGSPKYAAPEVWSGFSYDHTIDWWSAGLILSEMTVVVANRRDMQLQHLHVWIQEGIRRHDMTTLYSRLRDYEIGSHPIRMHITRLVRYNPADRATSRTLYVMDT